MIVLSIAVENYQDKHRKLSTSKSIKVYYILVFHAIALLYYLKLQNPRSELHLNFTFNNASITKSKTKLIIFILVNINQF